MDIKDYYHPLRTSLESFRESINANLLTVAKEDVKKMQSKLAELSADLEVVILKKITDKKNNI